MWLTSVKFGLCALLFLTIAARVPHGDAANILGVFTSNSPSHVIVHMSVMKALAERGHNITVVTILKPKVTHPSIKIIQIAPSEELERQVAETMSTMAKNTNNFITTLAAFVGKRTPLLDIQHEPLMDERFQALYDTESNNFDLLFLGFFMADSQLGIAAKLKVPVIFTWMGRPMDIINRFVGNPYETSYVPNVMMTDKLVGRMTFRQRLQNKLMTLMLDVVTYLTDRKSEQYFKQLFGNEPNFPTLNELRRNVSLVFCNSHFSEGVIRPNVPAIVEIGGIQVKPKPDPLPTDIADWMNGANEHGVIFFSLGSNIKADHLDLTKVNFIFKTLASLKQRIIWKWDQLDNTPGKSDNIMYKSWVPQDDILAHPNLRLFITHAGKGGVAESMYHGVPMLALPIFADQHSNAAHVEASGFGLSIALTNLDEDSMRHAINELLSNESYHANAKQFSRLYRDRPLSAREEVVYWTEYVLRYHGAPHIQSPLVHLNFFERYSLDILATFLGVLFIIYQLLRLVWRLIRCGLRKILAQFRRPKDSQKKKKSN